MPEFTIKNDAFRPLPTRLYNSPIHIHYRFKEEARIAAEVHQQLRLACLSALSAREIRSSGPDCS